MTRPLVDDEFGQSGWFSTRFLKMKVLCLGEQCIAGGSTSGNYLETFVSALHSNI